MLTLGVRGERHARNAAALAEWLERQDGVDRVLYPGLPSHPQHATAMRQFRPAPPAGCSRSRSPAVAPPARPLIDHLTLPELTASLGSVHTMVVHPPSTSQRQMSEAELLAAGISPGLLRVSVGLEDVEDIEADIADALAAARAVRRTRDPGRRLGVPPSRPRTAVRPPSPDPPRRTPSPGSGAGCGAS